MRQKIYFIISSIIGILNLIYLNIYNVDKLIKIETENIQNTLGNNQNILYNPYFYYFLGFIGIFSFLIIILVFSKNKQNKYRDVLISLSIIIFLTSSSGLLMLIPIINVLLLKSIKKEEKIKKEMPILEKNLTNKKDIIKSLILIFVYFFVNFAIGNIVDLFLKNPSDTFKILFNIITDIFLLTTTFILFYQEIINSYKILFKNIQGYVSYLLKNYGILILVNVGISLIIAIFKGEMITSQNQISINSLPLWYLLPASVIYAPIVEEIVFRGCFRHLIKNDNLFIIISGVCFGLLHTIGQEANIINTFVLALPYMAMGMVLAFTYVKSNNISTNITIHSANNLLGCLIRFF